MLESAFEFMNIEDDGMCSIVIGVGVALVAVFITGTCWPGIAGERWRRQAPATLIANDSVVEFLDGMKGAFWTSLFGLGELRTAQTEGFAKLDALTETIRDSIGENLRRFGLYCRIAWAWGRKSNWPRWNRMAFMKRCMLRQPWAMRLIH